MEEILGLALLLAEGASDEALEEFVRTISVEALGTIWTMSAPVRRSWSAVKKEAHLRGYEYSFTGRFNLQPFYNMPVQDITLRFYDAAVCAMQAEYSTDGFYIGNLIKYDPTRDWFAWSIGRKFGVIAASAHLYLPHIVAEIHRRDIAYCLERPEDHRLYHQGGLRAIQQTLEAAEAIRELYPQYFTHLGETVHE